MDKKILEFLKETLRPDQSELLEVAEGFAECCEEDPSMPSATIDFFNKLCSQFPFLIKRPKLPDNPDPPPEPSTHLTREQLHFILKNSFLPQPQSESEEELERLSRLNKRKSSLLHVTKCLEKHILEMKGEKARLEARAEQATDRTKKLMAVLTVENERFNELAATLTRNIEKLKYYLDPNGADPPVFLTYLPMDEFYEAQQEYTSELNKFSQAAFSKNLSEFTDKRDSPPDAMSQWGEPGSFEKVKEKILQVQSMKSLSLMKKIRLELKLAEVKAKKECLEQWKERVEKAKLEDDKKTAFMITKATEEEVKKYEEKFKEDCKKIPEMIEKIAMGQITELFDGELKRRIAIQDKVLEKQERLIHYLKHQHLTYILLSNLYKAEGEKVKELSEALKSIQSLFEEAERTSQLLEESSRETGQGSRRFSEDTPRLIIPSSDKATLALYKLLRLENKSRFPTYQVLTEAISNLQVKLCAAEKRNEYVQEYNLSIAVLAQHKLKEACDQMQEFEQQSTQLIEGPQGRQHLEKLLHEFEHKMKEVLHTINSKKQELLQHPTYHLERRMETAYYTDKQLYTQLKQKVESIKQNQ